MEPPPRLLAEGPRQRHLLHHHDRAVGPLRGQRRRHLAADVAAADQHHPLGALGRLADRVRVAERPQVVDPLLLGALDAQDVDVRARWRSAPSRTPTSSPPCSFAVRALDVERHHVRPGAQLDPVLLVPGDRVDVGVLPLGLAAQVLLRERRPLVRRLGLAPDQQDRPRPRPASAARRRSGRRRCPADQQDSSTSRQPPAPSVGPKNTFSSSSSPGSSTASTSSPGLEHRVGRRARSPLPLAQDRDQQAALGHVQVADPLPGDPAVVRRAASR